MRGVNPVASIVLAKARTYLGQMESPANSNRHPSVTWYNSHVANLGPAWNYCAAGVTKEFWETVAKPILTGRAYVPYMMKDFLDGKHGGTLIWIDDNVSLVKAGDVVFFDWSKPVDGRHSTSTGNHVGIVEGIVDWNTVTTIEHNTSVPGTGNEGTTRKVRDARYIVAVGRPNWDAVSSGTAGSGGGTVTNPLRIPGTTLPLLEIDGDLGPKTIRALGTVLKARGTFKGTPGTTITPELVKAIQTDLNASGKRDANGHRLVVDGKGFGSNSDHRYPLTGSTHTIEALQIGHGVARSDADGYFDKGESTEVKRLQRDINGGGTKDSPLFSG